MFRYEWYLKDGYPARGISKHNRKVFTTFACGGGSSMGYKLAGYDVIAANDIDMQMARVYKRNNKVKHFFCVWGRRIIKGRFTRRIAGHRYTRWLPTM